VRWLSNRLPAWFMAWLSNDVPAHRGLACGVAQKRRYASLTAGMRHSPKLSERGNSLTRPGRSSRIAQAHNVLGQALYEIGRWDEALTEIAVVPEHLQEPLLACRELAIAAEIAFHRNEVATARSNLAAAQVHAPRLVPGIVPALALAQSLNLEQAGRLDEALAVLATALDTHADGAGDTEDLLADSVRLALKTGNAARWWRRR
jgi:hypothetical protein